MNRVFSAYIFGKENRMQCNEQVIQNEWSSVLKLFGHMERIDNGTRQKYMEGRLMLLNGGLGLSNRENRGKRA